MMTIHVQHKNLGIEMNDFPEKSNLECLEQIYDKVDFKLQKERYLRISLKFSEYFSHDDYSFFSVPGRSELGGNHTDHNHGCVIAASIHLDSIGAAALSNNNIVTIYSEGYHKPFIADLSELEAKSFEAGKTEALIRGVASGFNKNGLKIGGFNAVISSNVLKGAGLSSSASIEILIGLIFSHLFNNGRVSDAELAEFGHFAETVYFNKPCGLMDQLACVSGGIIEIDFENIQSPVIKKVPFSFTEYGYCLVIVDTGGDHADLTGEYTAVPAEMGSVAEYFGDSVLQGLSYEQIISSITELRKKTGDRAILRAIHFIEENKRVKKQVSALKTGKIEKYLELVNKSGNSSWKQLQNCISTQNPREQGITLALTLTDIFLQGRGASRVHGGGFAGTIQAYIPTEMFDDYTILMEKIFKKSSVIPLAIRKYGAVKLPF